MSRVVLAYSGGLDTSVLLKKLILEGHEVIALTADLGESDGGLFLGNHETRILHQILQDFFRVLRLSLGGQHAGERKAGDSGVAFGARIGHLAE